MKLNHILFLILIIAISACNPLNKKYNEKTFFKDLTELKNTNQMSNEDITIVSIYILTQKVNNIDLSNKTYSELLEDANQKQLMIIGLEIKKVREKQIRDSLNKITKDSLKIKHTKSFKNK